jgi:hypothetical protein
MTIAVRATKYGIAISNCGVMLYPIGGKSQAQRISETE